MPLQRFELVIFDCDGVLVDSERITGRVFCEVLGELGLNVTLKDIFERFVGNSMARDLEIITELLGTPPPDTFEAQLRQRIAAALAAEVEAVQGIEEALNAIDLPCCVASSGEHEKIRITLGRTRLLKRFEGRIYSAQDVRHAKPAPDVYLHAAAKMQAKPERCAVIEDTPIGVKAGVVAGMCVFGFAADTPAHRLRQAGAHETFTDMAELPLLISRGLKVPAGEDFR